MGAEMSKELKILPEIQYGTRPKVLVVGNGINLSFPGAKKTDSIIQNEWKKHYDETLPGRLSNETFSKGEKEHPIWSLPFPMQVVVSTRGHVQECMTDIADSFKEQDVSEKQKDLIKEILKTRFDAVLTTNYSLEFEKSTIENPTDKRLYNHYRRTAEQTEQQKQFGVFQCTELPFENNPFLWHIHGTALRKKSLIMGQFYYGKLLTEVVNRSKVVIRSYQKSQSEWRPFCPLSWVDYFLIGDLHIIGFSMDFSESDIWWLLGMKKTSVFSDSKVVLYNPDTLEEKMQLMCGCYNIDTPRNIAFDDSVPDDKYINYYKAVCKKINGV